MKSLFWGLCALSFLLTSAGIQAQTTPTGASTTQELSRAQEQKEALQQKSLLMHYPVRSIGPVVQGARVTDIAVTSQPHRYYIAYASGGVFKTEDDGITFNPVFDNQGALTVGDIALAPSDENILYVGTGEKNSSRSSYAGAGLYRTTDGAKSWKFLGLAGTQHISRIIVHPDNPNIVWVAAIGSLYTNNAERGVYKSTDGGQSWSKTLFLNDSTGIIDLEIDPMKPEVLYAAAWERTRKAWNFKGNGPGSGIYKSTDGGISWSRLEGGFPQGNQVGRIGLSIAPSQPRTLYALLDNQEESKVEKKTSDLALSPAKLMTLTRDAFLKLTDEQITEYLKENRFPKRYTARKVRQEIQEERYQPRALADYLGDANSNLFDTQVSGAQVYRSDDAGASWQMVNKYPLEGVYYTYGYYFGEIRTSPQDPEKVYILGVPMLSSNDGGQHWYRVDTTGEVHVDHQALWINPNNDKHLMLGNDGGLYISYNGGANWRHLNNLAVGQFYSVEVDNEKPYNVYGGLQDNGVLMGSSQSVPNRTDNWKRIMGGDGMVVQVDPGDVRRVYTGYQFGNYYRLNLESGSSEYITPQPNIGEDRLRFNWRTPLLMSSHNPDILYIGAQKVYRSLDMGANWEPISPDLTRNLPQGNVPYSTISVLAESPHKFGLLYAGTDDGNLQLTLNGGASWQRIDAGLPQDLWVSSLEVSAHRPERVYVTLTGYRQDNFRAYLYRSDDYGSSWTPVKGNLPEEAVNVLREDPENENLLYVGTDHGTYLSLNGGQAWQPVNQMPNVANYDMIVHPQEGELVIGTHGRSIYIMDIKPLRQLLKKGADELFLAELSDLPYREDWGEKLYPYLAQRQPSVALTYYLPSAQEARLEVTNEKGGLVYQGRLPSVKGFNQWEWNGQLNRNGVPGRRNKVVVGGYLQPAAYTLTIRQGDKSVSRTISVKKPE